MSLQALVLLLVISPPSSPIGSQANGQGLFLRPVEGTSGGMSEQDSAILSQPGDRPTCFDVALGPLPLDIAGKVPSPDALGAELFVLDWETGQRTRVGSYQPEWADYVPLSESGLGLRLRWEEEGNPNSYSPSIETFLPGTVWSVARACIDADPSVRGRYWLMVSAPAASLNGIPRDPDAVQPSPRGGFELHSTAYHLQFTSADDRRADEASVIERQYRAERLGLKEQALSAAREYAAMDPTDPVRPAMEAKCLQALGRYEEAAARYERAISLCEAIPDCPAKNEQYANWKFEVRLGIANDANHRGNGAPRR